MDALLDTQPPAQQDTHQMLYYLLTVRPLNYSRSDESLFSFHLYYLLHLQVHFY